MSDEIPLPAWITPDAAARLMHSLVLTLTPEERLQLAREIEDDLPNRAEHQRAFLRFVAGMARQLAGQ